MLKNRKSKFLILILAVLMLLVACGGKGGSGKSKTNPDELVVGVTRLQIRLSLQISTLAGL